MFFLLVFWPLPLLADEIITLKYDPSGSDGWVPYYMQTKSGQLTGIIPELLQNLLTQANVRGDVKNYPPKRTNQYLIEGKLDFDLVNPEWIADETLRNKFVYSAPLLPINEYFIAKQETDTTRFSQNYQNGSLLSVATVRGYYYHDEKQLKRVDFASEHDVIKALKKDRLQVGISGDLPALYWSQKEGVQLKLFKLHSSGYIRVRMRKELEYLLPRFNRAIGSLKQQGFVQKQIEKYTSHLK